MYRRLKGVGSQFDPMLAMVVYIDHTYNDYVGNDDNDDHERY